jgi:hypothetical protein
MYFQQQQYQDIFFITSTWQFFSQKIRKISQFQEEEIPNFFSWKNDNFLGPQKKNQRLQQPK